MSGDSKRRQLFWEAISGFSEAQEGGANIPAAEPRFRSPELQYSRH